MHKTLGIISETKNEWERRVPLIPDDVKTLLHELPIEVNVQPSKQRIFPEQEYESAGAAIKQDLTKCDIILGIKEIKNKDLIPEKVYLYFSHTIKGQSYNMPMLRKLLDLNCTLIDYERIVNEKGQRLIYFSVHAGIAGMIDTLWTFGQRLNTHGVITPFKNLKQTYKYKGLDEAEAAIKEVGEQISSKGLPESLTPMICGITGYGNVSKGAQRIFDLLPMIELQPSKIKSMVESKSYLNKNLYKVIFKEEDMVEPILENSKFELQDYYNYPEKYQSKFNQFLPFLTILVNGSFWDTPYPKHVTKESIKKMYSKTGSKVLQVIGDISCDVDGGIECTLKTTDLGNPVYVYDPDKNAAIDGFKGNGPVIMAIDNLPCELPLDASIYFSSILKTLIPALVKADFSSQFDKLQLPDSIKNAIIVYKGEIAADYKYLKKYIY